MDNGYGPPDPEAVRVLRGPVLPAAGYSPAIPVLFVIDLVVTGAFLAFAAYAGLPGYAMVSIAAILLLPMVPLLINWIVVGSALRRLAVTDLYASPNGVSYACGGDWYHVPWQAVRWVGFAGRPGGSGRARDVLCVDAAGWRGPVTRVNSARRAAKSLRVALEGTDRRAVAHAVQAASGRTVSPG